MRPNPWLHQTAATGFGTNSALRRRLVSQTFGGGVETIMGWLAFDDGATVGQRGSESGVIVRDEEHEQGARITLERDCGSAPFTITCGIYGWFFHTRFFGSESEGATEFVRMRAGLDTILAGVRRVDDPDVDAKCARMSEEIAGFVAEFP